MFKGYACIRRFACLVAVVLLTSSKLGPISLQTTKNLVRDSLRNYLSTALGVRRTSLDSREPDLRSRHHKPSSSTVLDRPGPSVSNGRKHSMVTTPTIEISESAAMGAEEAEAYVNFSRPGNATQRSYSSSYPETRPDVKELHDKAPQQSHICRDPDGKRLFRPLEDYIISCFSSPIHCVNTSFMQRIPRAPSRRVHPPSNRRPSESRKDPAAYDPVIPELDPKLLLLGDFAENGSWWTGKKEETAPVRKSSRRDDDHSIVTSRSPNIEWPEVESWYNTVINAGGHWVEVYDDLSRSPSFTSPTEAQLKQLESQILEAQEHLRKTLLKVTENLLKRPGKPVATPEDLRFLLILSANPLLQASFHNFTGALARHENNQALSSHSADPSRGCGPVSGQHSPIIKRILGLLSHTPMECQNHLVTWFARLPEFRFIQLKQLSEGFLAHRLIRQNEKRHETKVDVTAGLIPQLAAGRSPASLHAALGQSSRSNRAKKPAKSEPKKVVYQDDWQTKAAARVLGLLFAANNHAPRRSHTAPLLSQDEVLNSNVKDQVQARGQIVPTSDFYSTLLDDSDLVADFEAWEQKKSKFSFCQFPFLLSIWAKIQILEHDAKRQMHNKARDAFFDSIMSRRNVEQYLTLNVRRDCLVEDSLKGVSEVMGGGGEDIKKGLRINFQGEEGVDAGGLRKEWFLLLVREVFNPDHGTLNNPLCAIRCPTTRS